MGPHGGEARRQGGREGARGRRTRLRAAPRGCAAREGRVDEVLILDGGTGYSVGDALTVDNTGTNGTGLVVVVSAVDAGVITKLNVVAQVF